MPLESGTTIQSLDSSWPLGGDVTSRGDDHIRLIKAVLKAQFPGSSGNGFNTPITVTETEINYLSGVSSNIQAQINSATSRITTLENNLIAPTNTRMLFHQASAPAGWTIDATLNDYMLRVVNAAGGGSGGVNSPIYINWDHSHTVGGHVLTIDEIPSHNHDTAGGYDQIFRAVSGVGTPGGFTGAVYQGATMTAVGGGLSHDHTLSLTNFLWFPQYTDVIIGVKS